MIILLSLLSIVASLDPEANMNVMQIIRYWGYPVEKYDVFTKDGFILDLYRIPHGRKGTAKKTSSTPILMLPGLLSSSATFVQNPPESSPAMFLADTGFDVFLLNHRGTKYGQRHTRLARNDTEFWNFTLDDYANYDVPAVVDKVLSITKQPSLHWIGHSQGTIIGFMFLADNPSYNSKIRSMFAIGPVGTTHYAKGISRLLLKLYQFIRPLVETFHLLSDDGVVGNNRRINRLFAERLCPPGESGTFCKLFWRWGNGPLSPSFNRSRQGVYFSHYPDATSVKTIEHYGQLASTNEIRHFDPNPEADIYHIKTKRYNYSNIVAPVYVFWSRNDWLATPMEMKRVLLPRLRKGVIKGMFEVPEYCHIEFVFGTDNAKRVFTPITKIIRSIEGGGER